MNYIGSVSILDRGDAPAQAVITKNARSLAQRMADETRDELNKVMTRVHTIYGSLENTEEYPTSANMEYLNDIAELQAILGDEIKKRQYQQQVTVFIVGYQDVCHQKLVLLQQVNEFFMENSKKIDEEDWFPTTPDLDMDEVSNTVEDSLNHAHELTNRLSELNQEMVEYIATMAEKKASNKGRKKIEKALQQAKEEVSGLSEKLLTLQRELDDREEKVQTMVKQLESKNMEVQKYRTAAELSKKAQEDLEIMGKELKLREAKIVAQRQQLSKMEVDLVQSNHQKERTETKLSTTDTESQQKIIMLQKEVDEMKKSSEEIKSDMSKFLDSQISALHESHRQEIDELKKQHETEAKKMQEELEDARQELAQAQHELIQLQIQKGVVHGETPSEVGRVFDLADSEPSRQSSVQESRPTTKDTRTSGKSIVSGKQSTKPGSKSPNRLQSKPGSRTSGAKSGKEFAEIAIQDEGGDPDTAVVEDKARTPATRQSRRSKSTLAPVLESDLDNAFDLFDDQAWATVPADQVSGRFAQYRRLSTNRLQDLEEQLQLTTARTKRKVETLKAQFQEHKSKWEAERRVLIEQVDQSLKLQTDAEKEADAAMTQLEDFISEQERLEQEEEVKRSEILHASASLTPAENSTPSGATPTTGTTPKAGTPHPQGDDATPDQELQRLMQQTDDAKVQEMNARLGSCVSAPPAVDLDSASVQRSERQRPATSIVALAKATMIAMTPAQQAMSRSGTPLAVRITNKTTGEVQIRDIIPGTVAPVSTPMPPSTAASQQQLRTSSSAPTTPRSATAPPPLTATTAGESVAPVGSRVSSAPRLTSTATTFLTPEGTVVITAPTDILQAMSQGLIPIEVKENPTLTRSASMPRLRQSPIESPTKQVTFGETMISPRSSRLRRSKTADLAVVMETSLGPSQEMAIEMMKKMMLDEENLKPKQLEALRSMRQAVKTVESRNSLSDEEIARTLTMMVLASQMSHEAFQLGVRPDSIFRTFSCMQPQSLSQMVPAKPMRNIPRAGMDGRESTRDMITRETTLESVLEAESETAPDAEEAQLADINLSQLKELPLLDIADKLEKPTSSGLMLPSEATRGSSIMDPLDTPLKEFSDDDMLKSIKEQGKGDNQGELMDDGSNLEKAQSRISEREATQAESEAQAESGEAEHDSTPGPLSKQATGLSGTGMARQKSLLGKSMSSLEAMKIEGTTEEEIRTSSALSRASLRETYKAKLDEAKIAAEDRRSKSPAINLPTKMTVDDELITDDDDEGDEYLEEEVALPDELKEEYLKSKDISMYEMGTSPPPAALHTSRDLSHLSKDASGGHTGRGGMDGAGGPFRDPSQPLIQKIVRKGSSLLNHPILQEYLKAYECVVSFKDGMGKMFLDKDMMSAHQMTSDLETLTFDHNQKAMPQVQELTKNVEYVLDELISLINNILVYEREPRVSSLNMLSREPTQKSLIAASLPPAAGGGVITEEKGGATPPTTRDLPSEASSHASVQSGRYSTGSEKKLIQDLQEQYNILKKQLEDASQNHQDQLQRNTVVMMEMQDTINELQRELSTLGKSSKRTKSALSSARGASVHLKSPSPETSVMFTRLDSERNAKIMKKAVMEEKLETEKYKEAVSKMDEYVSLPAQRLAHLVKKYVHHSRMRAIEEKVKNSSSLDQDVFEVLDKMESLQNKRARQWAERMDDMGIERLRMANLLMDTLDHIEQESGIFLIKPMYSYRGRDMKPSHAAKLSRPTRQQNRNATPSHDGASTFIPAPTPASNYRLVRHERYAMQQQQQHVPSTMAELRPSESRQAPDDEVKVAGSGMTFSAGQPNTTWNMQVSQAWAAKDDPGNAYNTPRILELDINRMLIGQNNISTKVPYPPTEDRLVNANQSTLRSYVTVNRPTATFGEKTDTRPTSAQDSARGRPSSARSSSAKRVRVSEVDKGLPDELPSASPLPPITPIPSGQNEEEDDEEEMETAREGKQGVDRPPPVAFSDDIEEHKEPPQSPPGSSLYQSTRLGETMVSDEE